MAEAPRQAKEKKKDSTMMRIDDRVGFNARVEPMWHTFDRLRERLGFFKKWKYRRRVRDIVKRINRHLSHHKIEANGWDKVTGKCICNLRVAKIGLIHEFQNYLASRLMPETLSGWNHLMALKESNTICIPVEFPTPFRVTPAGEEQSLLIISSVLLLQNLKAANKERKIEERFALAKMSKIDYVNATERDIGIYESRFASLDDFWPMFSRAGTRTSRFGYSK